MQTLIGIGIVIGGYIVGSIPFGLLIVRSKTGKDIRTIESGRTGGTNAMRAAGVWAGVLTATLDTLKSIAVVFAAQALTENHLVQVLAAASAIIGHNYSIFLAERDEKGRLRLRGGAGAMPAVGGAIGFWGWSFPILLGLGALVFFTVGIASLATIIVGMSIIILFAIRAAMGLMPWAYVLYGVIAELLLIWALRTNIQKLLAGNERVVSISLAGQLRNRRDQREAAKQREDP